MTHPLERYLPDRPLAFAVQGNEPLVLDRSSRMWLVDSGHVDVFAVSLAGGQPVGRRRFLFRAGAGEVLFGRGEGGGSGLCFYGTGAPGTRVVMGDRGKLEARARAGLADAEDAAMIERWVRRLSRVGEHGALPRELVRAPAGGDVVALAPGQALGVEHGVVWAQPLSGRLLPFGAVEGGPVARGQSYPLSSNGWLVAPVAAEVAVVDTLTWLATDARWRALEGLAVRVLEAAERAERRDEEEEAARVRARIARDAARMEGALEALGAALGDAGAVGAAAPSEAWLEVTRRVARAARISPSSVVAPGGAAPREGEAALEAIARASRVRLRAVTLEAEWWRHDAGPLVGLRAVDEGRVAADAARRSVAASMRAPPAVSGPVPARAPALEPVALLFGRGGYRAVDARGQGAPVTAERAARIEARAFTLYRPFPAGSLSPLSVLRFGLAGGAREVTALGVLGLAAAALGLLPALATGLVVEHVIPGASRRELAELTLLLLVFAVASATFGAVRGLALLRLEERAAAAVQAALWDRLLRLPATFFRGYSAGDLAQRANGVDGARRLLAGGALSAVLGGLFSLVNLTVMVGIDPRMALAGLAIAALGALMALVTAAIRARIGEAREAREGQAASLLLQLFVGVSKLRVASAERRAFATWAAAYARVRRVTLRGRVLLGDVQAVGVALPLLSSAVMFVLASSRGLGAGEYLTFAASFAAFLGGTLGVVESVGDLADVVPLYRRAAPILAAEPEVESGHASPGVLRGEIELSHVVFGYRADGPPVLDDVSLHARPGELVAVVGRSGSGKSTLLRLLVGFERPTAGAVFYDGQDLAGLDRAEVRRQLGIVLQGGQILQGSVYDNIAGTSRLSLDEAWAVARMAALDDDIRAMPMGMQTFLDEGGASLSGGQRQRLVLARAIARRPRVLLLDEATSALDNRTQAAVIDSLERLDATRIVIAHRLSTIERADRIYVLDRGRVVQQGTFSELMAQGGLFRELAERQLA